MHHCTPAIQRTPLPFWVTCHNVLTAYLHSTHMSPFTIYSSGNNNFTHTKNPKRYIPINAINGFLKHYKHLSLTTVFKAALYFFTHSIPNQIMPSTCKFTFNLQETPWVEVYSGEGGQNSGQHVSAQ